MPDFSIKGDPGAVRAKAGVARQKGASFRQVGESLAKVTTDGWTGRAADTFRDKFDAEPERWHKAGAGFERAAAALEGWADALADAQARAEWAEGEYARGEQVTRDARAAYDADVARARREVADAAAQGTTLTLTIIPFSDPGQGVRDGALAELASARAALDAAAHECAGEVRAGCADAPDKRNWLESAAAAVGGVFVGAGEALWDLGKLVTTPLWRPIADLQAVLSGDLTLEELAMRNRLTLEQAGALLQALKDDPVEFGKQLGKGLLDWDTWADDPSRALGHLVPDLVAAVFTGGTAAAVTRGLKGADALADLAALGRGADGLDGLNDARHAADGLDGLSDLVRSSGIRSPQEWDDVLSRISDPDSLSAYRLRDRYSQDYYEAVRSGGEGSLDEIARSSGMARRQIEQIERHLFHEQHDLGDGRIDVFDSDPDIADAWRRLSAGKPLPNDLDLLRHELAESNYMRQHGVPYPEAHEAVKAQGFTWQQPEWHPGADVHERNR
ncbi:putative T7SS-secreted protein [Motilibacter deserti]|uniref:Putative T7SS secretion signal domain-containing protein n=1 Tax=Motilibacter deserti TaxID=2714956 RepID=A0ABX0GR41_9ACTN|nr:hypothetical protein [Motilibacter deserti]NHC12938.1 hypothetical protein [Motilibacter deserti]